MLKKLLSISFLFLISLPAFACNSWESEFIAKATVELAGEGLCQVKISDISNYWPHYRCPVYYHELLEDFVVKADDCTKLLNSDGTISGVAVRKDNEDFYTIE